MKKYLLVSLTILFAAAFVWAEEAAPATPSVDVEADATLSWGIDLGQGDLNAKNITHGFKNEASFSVKFPLIKKGNKVSAKTDAPVYGQVSLKDIELKFLSEKGDNAFRLAGQVKDIEAKLFFYGAYLTVYDAPSFRSNYAQIWKPLENDDKYEASKNRFRPGFGGMGTKLGYTNKNFMDLDVGVKLGSNGPWSPEGEKANDSYWKYFDGNTKLGENEVIDAHYLRTETDAKTGATKRIYTGAYGSRECPPEGNYLVTKLGTKKAESSSKYGVGVDFSIKPLDKMLELALTVNSTFSKDYGSGSGLNFGVEVKSQPIDGLKLKAGFDGGIGFVSGSKFNWDTVFTADYKWIGAGVYFAPKDVPGVGAKLNLSAFAKFETKADKKDATNLVEGLNAGAYVGLYRLLDASNGLSMLTKVWGSYTIGLNDSSWIEPFATVWIETASKELALAYNLGVVYSPVEKVEVEAKWQQGTTDTFNKHGRAIDTSAIGKDHHNGRFVLSLKLIY